MLQTKWIVGGRLVYDAGFTVFIQDHSGAVVCCTCVKWECSHVNRVLEAIVEGDVVTV